MTEQERGPSTMSTLDDFWFAQGPMIHGPDLGSIDIGPLLAVADHDDDAKRLVERHNATIKALIAAARRAEALEKAFDRIDSAWKQRQSMPEWMAAMRTGIELARAARAAAAESEEGK